MLLYPLHTDTEENTHNRGLITRLKSKKAIRAASVPRHPPAPLPKTTVKNTPTAFCYRSVFPVFPPKKSKHSPKPSLPTGSHPLFPFPSLQEIGNFPSQKGVLAHRLLTRYMKRGRSGSRSKSPGWRSDLHPVIQVEEGPMVVVPLTPAITSKESSRLATEMDEDYSNPRLLARCRPSQESRRVVYARREPSTDWSALYTSLNCSNSP